MHTIRNGGLLFLATLIFCIATIPAFAQQQRVRCATVSTKAQAPLKSLPAADCTLFVTDPKAEYDPTVVKYRIPVVVHVIQHTNGDGNLSNALVQSGIDILNEDFLALSGTNGQNGVDVQIEFYLATEDPGGSPTTGITRSTNNTWFIDSGSYWNTLAWDTNRYMNIYTNDPGGALGYVPGLPQSGVVGSSADRVVVYWAAFGRNAIGGEPYDQGRTLTHEVGHYLGLEHVFWGGCAAGGSPGCYSNADLICDTNPQSFPQFGCPGGADSCAGLGPDNITNYMDYTDDLCMEEFTAEQARRMRCTLEHWRPDLFELASVPSPPISGLPVAEVGDTITLSVPSVTGDFQWKKDDIDIPGANDPTLVLGPLTLADSGIYTAEIDDGGAKAIITTLPFTLTVFPAGSLPVTTAAGLSILFGVAVSAGTFSVLRRKPDRK
jgi:hypothetical protein